MILIFDMYDDSIMIGYLFHLDYRIIVDSLMI